MRSGALVLVVVVVSACSAACSGGGASPHDREGPATSSRDQAERATSEDARSPRVSRREQEEGLQHCGEVLERMESPESAPTFARLLRECAGMFARRRCRDALGADSFSRDAIAAACRDDYCGDLRPAPSFCTTDMPSDREFLAQYARFGRMVLRRDLRRVMDREGAEEIADLYGDLVDAQVSRAE